MLQAKREQLKKEGKLLTKKQKEERHMAELRKQALLASGVQIEGLQQQGSGSAPPAGKKVVYGNRKKKGPNAKEASPAGSPAPESRPRSPEPTPTPPPEPVKEEEKGDEDVKSDWDASSDEETESKPTAPAKEVKSDWDASSDEEAPAAPALAEAKPKPEQKGTYPHANVTLGQCLCVRHTFSGPKDSGPTSHQEGYIGPSACQSPHWKSCTWQGTEEGGVFRSRVGVGIGRQRRGF